MTDRGSQLLQTVGVLILGIALTLTGYFSRIPGFMEEIWWIPFALGIVLIVIGLVGIGSHATQPTELPCPYCGQKIVARRRGLRDHLRLFRTDEE